MRNLAIWSLAALGCASVYAAPVGNPAFPRLLDEGYFISSNSWVDVRLGYEGDFINDARMRKENGGSGRIDNFSQDTNSGTATFNFVDRLDVYGVFGATHIETDWRFSFEDTIRRVQLETSYQFGWAVGGRAVLFEWGKTTLGLGGRYHAANLKPVWAAVNGSPISTSGSHLHAHGWQIDLDLAYKIDIFVPYIGVKYSRNYARAGGFADPISSSGTGSQRMENRRLGGIVVGCALTSGKYFMLNIEGRLIDEEAATISGDFRF